MLKVRDQPLRRQLFAALLLLLAPMLAAAGWLGLATYRERVQELAEEASLAAARTAAGVEREMTGFDRLARNLTINPAIHGFDAKAIEPLLRSPIFQRPFLVDIMLIDRTGLVARGAALPGISGGWMELAAPVFDAGNPIVSVTPMSARTRPRRPTNTSRSPSSAARAARTTRQPRTRSDL